MPIRELWRKGKLRISPPQDPIHITHVAVDCETGEYSGLPKEWQEILCNHQPDDEESLKRVLDILNFYKN
ncbi:uncharacterized protein BDR25DRAFT_216618, partial [Lindgomyces ingoldianus]